MTMSLSAVPLPEQCVVVFDLDDTLYPERDFVRSGFQAVASLIQRETGTDPFDRLMELFDGRQPDPFGVVLLDRRLSMDKESLIRTYREHQPKLVLTDEVRRLLQDLRSAGHALGILTDGRSVTQRNKIRALELDQWIDAVLISEEFGSAKPAERNYRHFERLFPGRRFVYVGDNPAKDFIAPNRLGWHTVCVFDGGRHIHAQHPDRAPADSLPHYWIERLA
jgi:putative hydrolase of the HAD superfamily